MNFTSVPDGTACMLNFKCMCKSFKEQMPDYQNYINNVTKRDLLLTYVTIVGIVVMQGKENLLCNFNVFNF